MWLLESLSASQWEGHLWGEVCESVSPAHVTSGVQNVLGGGCLACVSHGQGAGTAVPFPRGFSLIGVPCGGCCFGLCRDIESPWGDLGGSYLCSL